MQKQLKLAAWPALLALALLPGCNRSGATLILLKDLAPGALQRSELVLVAAADAEKTVITGDYADDPPTVAANRERLRGTFAPKIAAALKAAGFQADVAGAGEPPADAVAIRLDVKMFDAGSAALRVWAGSRSHLLTGVKVTRGGAVVAELTLDAYSDWHAEIQERLDGHIDDSVACLVEHLQQKLAP